MLLTVVDGQVAYPAISPAGVVRLALTGLMIALIDAPSLNQPLSAPDICKWIQHINTYYYH